MLHNDIAYICRQMVAEAYQLESYLEVPYIPWDGLIYEFARGYNGPYNTNAVKEAFHPLLKQQSAMSKILHIEERRIQMYYFVTYLSQPRTMDVPSDIDHIILKDIHPIVWVARPEVSCRDSYFTRLLFWEQIPPEVVRDDNVWKWIGVQGISASGNPILLRNPEGQGNDATDNNK